MRLVHIRHARAVRARARIALATGAVAGTVLASGCATIPTSGPPQSTPAPPPGGNITNCCGLIVKGWQPGLAPGQLVKNFLLASASFAHDHAIARGYLTPAASKLWKPGSKVTILAQTPKVVILPHGVVGAESNRVQRVQVSGQKIATLDPSGQYIPVSSGGSSQNLDFTLGMTGGRLLITALPPGAGEVSHELLLTTDLFHLVYRSYNLYFHARRGGVLVPDPVFVPADSTNPDTTLVDDLLRDPKGWLSGAAVSAFPHGSRLVRVTVVPGLPAGKTAIIDVHLPSGISRSAIGPMAEQVVWTLTTSAYNPPLAQAVELRVNGRLWSPPGSQGVVLTTADFHDHAPRAHSNAPLYFVRKNGGVSVLTSRASHSTAVPGQAGTGQIPLDKVAVSPDGKYLAGLAGQGTVIYTSNLSVAAQHPDSPAAELQTRLKGSSLTAPSWDNSDDLWVAGRVGGSQGIWVLPGGGGQAMKVNLPDTVNGPVTGLRVAPDGVRIALIVGRGAAAHILLGSIVRGAGGFSIMGTVPLGPGLTGVTALTWYNRDRLLAITQEKSGSRLWDVLANGDRSPSVAGPPDMTSVTADGPHGTLYLGVSSGHLQKSVGIGEPWTDSGPGHDATYPG